MSPAALPIFTVLVFVLLGGLMFAASSKHLATGKDFETRRLYFAAVILSGLGIVFIFCAGLYYISDTTSGPGKEIFGAAQSIIPPIVTLVIGYYFGQDQISSKPTSLPENPETNGEASGATEGT
ncbi:Uncharacterised protein [Halioglobus japonicus]|nr:Uncharacterised protein [Halioglobus japonicus]